MSKQPLAKFLPPSKLKRVAEVYASLCEQYGIEDNLILPKQGGEYVINLWPMRYGTDTEKDVLSEAIYRVM